MFFLIFLAVLFLIGFLLTFFVSIYGYRKSDEFLIFVAFWSLIFTVLLGVAFGNKLQEIDAKVESRKK